MTGAILVWAGVKSVALDVWSTLKSTFDEVVRYVGPVIGGAIKDLEAAWDVAWPAVQLATGHCSICATKLWIITPGTGDDCEPWALLLVPRLAILGCPVCDGWARLRWPVHRP